MADKNIKKVIVPPEKLLSVNVNDRTNTSQYFVRYRVISEDKTRQSAWSPVYQVQARTVNDIIGDQDTRYNIFSNGDRVTLTWTPPAILKTTAYDIYTQWYAADGTILEPYSYSGTSTTNSFNIGVKQNALTVKFWIQVSTFPKLQSTSAMIKETDQATTIYKISGGTIS